MNTPEQISTRLHNLILQWNIHHFSGPELLEKAWTTHGNALNEPPPPEIYENIIPTLTVLDEIRATIGKPITIHSAYRNPAYNAAVGGERHSQHLAFRALDFSCDTLSPERLAKIADGLRGRRFGLPWQVPIKAYGQPLDVAGLDIDPTGFRWRGGIGVYPTFVHIDCRGYDADWSR